MKNKQQTVFAPKHSPEERHRLLKLHSNSIDQASHTASVSEKYDFSHLSDQLMTSKSVCDLAAVSNGAETNADNRCDLFAIN
jgi:hypothetical protein